MGVESTEAERSDAGDGPRAESLGTPRVLLLLGAFFLVGFAIYGAALEGPFINDDLQYLVSHPYTGSASLENVFAILDPMGPAKLYAVNYAPVHLLLCVAERALFGEATRYYHIVNVAVHALNCVLVVALLLARGIPRVGALVGGFIFAVHPANVEAVAWISQLKTLAAFAFGMGALLLFRRRPAVATFLYALALLTKFLAFPLLFVAAAFAWSRPGRSAATRTARWLAAWAAVALLVVIPQIGAFTHGGVAEVAAFADPTVHLRTVAAIGARYIAMAATGYGVACFHEPPPVLSWTDPWWLISLPLGAALLWRLAVSLRERREEGAWWVFAATSYGPISQLFPFFYGMGDRYLYFILPGLIGGSLLFGASLLTRFASDRAGLSTALSRVATGLGVAVAVVFALQGVGRAALWANADYVLLDAARAYPSGTTALYLKAVAAAHRGDPQSAIAALRAAERSRPLSQVRQIATDPRLAPLFEEPEFTEYLKEIAATRIELARRGGYDDPVWLRSVASAHEVREEYDEAIETLERAIRLEGSNKALLLEDLERVTDLRRRARGGALPDEKDRP